MCGFGFDGSVTVTVRPNYNFSTCRVLPEQYVIRVEIIENGTAVRFTFTEPPAHVSHRSIRAKAVPQTPPIQQCRRRLRGEFCSQSPDVNVHRSRSAVVVHAPNEVH